MKSSGALATASYRLVIAIANAVPVLLGTKAWGGNLYVSYLRAHTIHEFGPDGTDLGTFASTGMSSPEGLAFDSRGNLYVAYPQPSTVHEFGPTGTDLGTFAGSGFGLPLHNPFGLAFDSSGNLYASEAQAPYGIHEFGSTGADLGTFAKGTYSLLGLAFDDAGNLYAGENLDPGTILRFSPSGKNLGVFARLPVVPSQPNSLAFDTNGNLFVANSLYDTESITEFSPTGVKLRNFPASAFEEVEPQSLAFDSSGNLYVANIAARSNGINYIQEFGPTGADLGVFAITGNDVAFLAFAPDVVTPEPSTFMLSTLGLLGLIGHVARRRQMKNTAEWKATR